MKPIVRCVLLHRYEFLLYIVRYDLNKRPSVLLKIIAQCELIEGCKREKIFPQCLILCRLFPHTLCTFLNCALGDNFSQFVEELLPLQL